jgi:hypothetical protein
VSKVETRLDEHDRRLEKNDDTAQRIQQQMGEQRDNQVRTQTLLEVMQKQLNDVVLTISKVLDLVNGHQQDAAKTSSRNWEKAFWFVMTSVGSIVATIIIAHYVHF